MSGVSLFWLLAALCLGACCLAIVKGGRAERIGAVVVLANLLASVAIETNLPKASVQIAQIALDAVTALGLLALALRYASPWLGAAMFLYAALFALHSYYLVMERPRDMFHFAANNLCFSAVSIALVVGTIVAWRQRLRDRGAKAASASA